MALNGKHSATGRLARGWPLQRGRASPRRPCSVEALAETQRGEDEEQGADAEQGEGVGPEDGEAGAAQEDAADDVGVVAHRDGVGDDLDGVRSEEHTSELQSPFYLV